MEPQELIIASGKVTGQDGGSWLTQVNNLYWVQKKHGKGDSVEEHGRG